VHKNRSLILNIVYITNDFSGLQAATQAVKVTVSGHTCKMVMMPTDWCPQYF